MVTDLEDLAKQFQGFQSMMKQVLDELSSISSWRGAMDESMGSLLKKSDITVACVLCLEHAVVSPPHSSGPGGVVDLNAHPASSTTTAAEGRDSSPSHQEEEGDGVLGPIPH